MERVYRDYFQTQDYRPHPKGLPEARQAIADYYASAGAALDPENIILTSGTSESFLYLFHLLGPQGGNFLTPAPAYPLFDSIAELAKVELRHYPLREDRDWGIDLAALEARCDRETRGVFLISPHNPTGAVAGAEEIRALTELCNRKNLALICDEVFAEFYFGAGAFPRPLASTRPHLLFTLNGLSKMFALPGLKLSWIGVSGETEKVAEAVDRLETQADTFLSCHTPIQKALPALFQEGAAFLADYRREVRRRRDLALQILGGSEKIRVVPPAGGFYLTAEILPPFPLEEEEFVLRLMDEEGVFVHPGYFYDYERGVHFTISFLTEPGILSRGLEKTLQLIHRLTVSS
ncbi:MAG TPA: pyridoxal phosphate-dependent aminotransferase [bacterium]|nr:pyridoxal phosphate-dependent aminotransferase [bacterium]